MTDAAATVGAAAAPSAAEVDAEPRMLDTYALLYAFTLLWTVPALLALSFVRLYSYTPLYTLLVALPPGLGVASLLLGEKREGSWGSLVGRIVLLTVLSVAGSVLFIFVGMLGLPIVIDWVVAHLHGTGPFAIVLLGLAAAPLAVVLVREARRGSWVHAAVLAVAIAVVGVVLYTSATPSRLLVDAVRKDQMSFFMGSLSWYLPAYGLAGAICRRLGLG
jgi:hypothetical protein